MKGVHLQANGSIGNFYYLKSNIFSISPKILDNKTLFIFQPPPTSGKHQQPQARAFMTKVFFYKECQEGDLVNKIILTNKVNHSPRKRVAPYKDNCKPLPTFKRGPLQRRCDTNPAGKLSQSIKLVTRHPQNVPTKMVVKNKRNTIKSKRSYLKLAKSPWHYVKE